jgi:hypothetical protein
MNNQGFEFNNNWIMIFLLFALILIKCSIEDMNHPENNAFVITRYDTLRIHKFDSIIKVNNNTIIKYQDRIKENKQKVNEDIKNINSDISVDSIVKLWRTIPI